MAPCRTSAHSSTRPSVTSPDERARRRSQEARGETVTDAKRPRAVSHPHGGCSNGWCVFDVDAHPNLRSAIEEARTSDIQVAVSNPCFELWLILHFRDNPGPRTPDEMLRLMRACLPGYDKHIDVDRFVQSYPVAVERGRRLTHEAAAMGEPQRNPSTGVWRLTEAIRIAVEEPVNKRGAASG